MSHQSVSDVEFIIAEVHRISNLIKAEGALPNLVDFDFALPSTSGFGQMVCGRAAFERLESLSATAAERAGLMNLVQESEAVDALSAALVEKFFRQSHPIDQRSVARMINRAGQSLKRKLVTREFHIPCHLVHRSDPAEFQIGPVSFVYSSTFRRKCVAERKLRGRRTEDAAQRVQRYTALDYFRSFDWVASVKVSGATASKAEEIARKSIQHALDFIQLYLGGDISDRMRVGGVKGRRDVRAIFYRDEGGDLSWQTSASGAGQVGPAANWAEWFNDEHGRAMVSAFGEALQQYVQSGTSLPLAERVLDATAWYGDASREAETAPRIVKYVTAVERLVITTKCFDGEIGNTLRERVAALCAAPGDVADREDWRKRTKLIYGIRSELVHGNTSRTRIRYKELDVSIAEWARHTILAMIFHLRPILASRSGAESRVSEWFDEVIAWVDALESEGK